VSAPRGYSPSHPAPASVELPVTSRVPWSAVALVTSRTERSKSLSAPVRGAARHTQCARVSSDVEGALSAVALVTPMTSNVAFCLRERPQRAGCARHTQCACKCRAQTSRVLLRVVALVTSNEFDRVASAPPVMAPVSSRIPASCRLPVTGRGCLESGALVTPMNQSSLRSRDSQSRPEYQRASSCL
jgi:hypothetical protein